MYAENIQNIGNEGDVSLSGVVNIATAKQTYVINYSQNGVSTFFPLFWEGEAEDEYEAIDLFHQKYSKEDHEIHDVRLKIKL